MTRITPFRLVHVLALGALLGLLGACASPEPETAAEAGPVLAGSEWRPVRLGDRAVGPETTAFVGFRADDQIVGNGGCNNFQGSWSLDGDRLTIGPLAATKMACLEGDVGAIEMDLFVVLDAVATVRRDDIVLFFYDDQSRQIATFAQTDWD